ncbi:ParB N-terminal domain-containing protein [Massilia alkalitolerans]|uniref:ParB N-terminal domain-containing protein n=1 Tax=Massilia alkalitolerans TaxID=286638 RepID=UPI000A025A3E|nr:ParB N-terminal domain-containing protein [Massilia alkalitolerans]
MAYANHMASLKAAAEDKSNPAVSKTTQFEVDPRAMEIEEGFNARPLDPDHVAAMSLAMRSGATFPPLEVRVEDNRILIVDGHHRHAAALDAIDKGFEIKALACRQFRGNDADRVAHMLNSASGLALTPLQLGVQYRKLIGFGWSEKQIADRRGKSAQHVKDMIRLAESNSDVHQAVTAGQISGTAALNIVKKHGSKAGAVIREGLEAAKASGKSKVTPKALARGAAGKVSDKQIVDWLVANLKISGQYESDKNRFYELDLTIAKTVEHTTDLRALLTAAAGQQ